MNAETPVEDQKALWNGTAGAAWVQAQALLDDMYRPFEELLVEAVTAASAQRVLDVGCGTGSTTLAVSRRDGRTGVGLDISAPMIAVARARAEREGSPARFIVADAQSYAFEPASFDAIISRFGVMFFADPLAAFANLRRALRDGGELHAIAWRQAAENPFMTAAERAAAPLLPNMPARRVDGPGQFAFADASRVRGMLERSGWAEIDLRPLDVTCVFPEKELVPYMTRLGPLGRVLDTVDEATRERVVGAVRAAFDPFVFGAEVRFNAACWMIRALNCSSQP
jgi:ubiquinone/menaquinone biosynthesis C-methylase UbiE